MSRRENGHAPAYGVGDRDEDYNRQRRLKSIHDAREDVIRVRNRAFDPTTRFDRGLGNLALFQVVKSYVMELEPLLLDAGDVGKKYLFDEPVAAFDISPPEDATAYYREHVSQTISGPPTAETIKIKSLADFIDVTPPFTLSWEVVLHRSGSKFDRRTWEEEVGVSERASNRAYRLCNEFMSEVGLDVEIEELTDTEADSDYSDLDGSEFDL